MNEISIAMASCKSEENCCPPSNIARVLKCNYETAWGMMETKVALHQQMSLASACLMLVNVLESIMRWF